MNSVGLGGFNDYIESEELTLQELFTFVASMKGCYTLSLDYVQLNFAVWLYCLTCIRPTSWREADYYFSQNDYVLEAAEKALEHTQLSSEECMDIAMVLQDYYHPNACR